jgi:lipoate-protein ligase A
MIAQACELRLASFALCERRGEPAELVVAPASSAPLAVFVRPTRRALVLGSAQLDAAADTAACAAQGVVVVRRRSGGGAVLVGPAEQVWLDIFVPTGDPLFDPDVSRAAYWLGELWAAALAHAGLAGAHVHRGAMAAGRYGRVACFAGLGPGEVTLGGRKVVGISQRRDRHGAWLFSMALTGASGPISDLAGLLRLEPTARQELAEHLDASSAPIQLSPRSLEEALAEGISRLRSSS